MSQEGLEVKEPQLDLAAIRERLANSKGREYWRSLDSLADTPAFREFLHREFSNNATQWLDHVSRRRFLKLMGASMGLAGLTACGISQPEKIVPYVREPEDMVQGKPLFYATATALSGYALGLLVESHEGRPTKIEGNPEHPTSQGATDIWAQASVLDLYDPDRSKVVAKRGRISTYANFLEEFRAAIGAERPRRGAGIRVLSTSTSSPTLATQMRAMRQTFPDARWYQYEPINEDSALAGAQLAFGRPVHSVYRFSEADVILSLDADFLLTMSGRVQYGREFARRRRPSPEQQGERAMNRFYMVESTPTNTGAKADHRLPLRAGEVEGFARQVAARLGVNVPQAEGGTVPEAWIEALVADLGAARGRSLIIPGYNQPPAVHALAHAMNQSLGNVGRTVLYTEPVLAEPAPQVAGLRQLTQELAAGQVHVLVILGGDPAYTAPADVPFQANISRAAFSVHLGDYGPDNSATSARTVWHVPRSHYLEAWGDTRAIDGTASIQQPLVEPLYTSRSEIEIMSAFSSRPDASSYETVRSTWRAQVAPNLDFEVYWRRAVHDGVVPNTALPPIQPALSGDLASRLGAPMPVSAGLELMFHPDPSIYDGRYANNGWLQELPKPLTKLVWDNAALVSPALAEELQLNNEDVVELRYQGRTLRAAVWIYPGMPGNSVSVWLGYGQPLLGRVSAGTGFNAYNLRTAAAPWYGGGLEIAKTGEKYTLVNTQDHHTLAGREIARHVDAEEYERNPEAVHELAHEPEQVSLYPEYAYNGHAWGMAVDMTTCIGCNACVVACQSENNIPIVGKDQVSNGREMHWIRIDTYYTGTDLDNPETIMQPMFCQHCEKAPCEYVCPVVATSHSSEGLNDMTYNRCVGTRFCSNNCPYKVRRFNWLQYHDKSIESLKLQKNPDVTVRERGVMEKCTYCTQRISAARINASKENRPIRDGEVLTACQAACPADALVFGNINEQGSHVMALKNQPRNYSVLGELNTVPRTTYLAMIRNPNPRLIGEGGSE